MLSDERLASALGFRISKVYNESTQQETPTTVSNVAQSSLQGNSPRNLVTVETGGEQAPITTAWCTRRAPIKSRAQSPIAYLIVLVLLSGSIFGLEVYRIREVGDLTEGMKSLHQDLQLLQNQLLIMLSPPNTQREFNIDRTSQTEADYQLVQDKPKTEDDKVHFTLVGKEKRTSE